MSEYRVRQLMDVKTRMRDGVQLSSHVWLPAEPGRYPVLLLRTPYTKVYVDANHAEWGIYFAKRGYAFVVQDVRGRGDSEGEFDFFFQETQDGYDAVEGLAAEPWANGRVGMIGVSYWGTTQWLAARACPPSLVCIAPSSPAGDYLNELPSVGGAFQMQWALTWLNETSGRTSQSANLLVENLGDILKHRPLITMDEAMGRKMRLFREFLENQTLNDYWSRIKLSLDDFERIKIPVLTVTGQFDGDQAGAFYYWNGLEATTLSGSPDRYLVLGPWTHLQSFFGGAESVGEMEFSKRSILDNKDLHARYFDRYLKADAAEFDQPRVSIFVTGANAWRHLDHYPNKDAVEKRLYLYHAKKGANSLEGDGQLEDRRPDKAKTDAYVYDPHDPVPFTIEFAADRRPALSRQDVLVYTTPPLSEPLEVTGPLHVDLYAASDARDTDFTAVISDVYPDGRSILLGSKPVGIIRARYRQSLDKEVLLQPGTVERYRIELGHLAHRFLEGHCIRIEISSSAFPLFNPNQNTGNPIATDTDWRVARQAIQLGGEMASALVLPVVPII